MTGYLRVRAGERHLGLPLRAVEEVVEVSRLLPVPGAHRAVRGVIPVRERMVPLAHLYSLLLGGDPPATVAESAVVIGLGGRRAALEVDAVEDLVQDAPGALPPGWQVPWAVGIGREGDTLIPVVDTAVLAERLQPLEVDTGHDCDT